MSSYLGSNGIGKLYLGSTEIAKAYLGSTLIYESGGQPQPSTSVPYIRNTSDTAYIDTGITPDSSTRVIVWARNWNPGANNHTYLFGSRVGNANTCYAVALLNGADTGKMRIAYGNANKDLTDKWTLFSWYHKYELNGKDFYVDDTLVDSGTSGSLSSNLNIFLFGLNNNGTFAGCNLPIDICAVQIYKNNVLVRDMKPVQSPSPGFRDAVSGTTFTNAGSGSLSYGEFDMHEYTPLNYIEATGGQYFDSGVNGGYAVPVVAKFRTSQAAAGCLVGFRGSSDWDEYCFSASGNYARMSYRLDADTNYRWLYNYAQSQSVSIDLVLVKGTTNTTTIYKNYARLGSAISPTSSSSYVSSQTLNIASLKLASSVGEMYKGRIYYLSIGTGHAFVPAKDGNGTPGMYDTYNDVFYESDTATAFVAGSEI